MTTIAEKNALKALLLSDSEFKKTGKLFEGRAVGADGKPIAGTWYLVLQVGTDDDSQERLTGPYSTRRPSVTFQCVGTTPEQAMWVSERVDSVLRARGRGQVLNVPGERAGQMQRDYISPVQIDADVSPPMWYQTVEYGFQAQLIPTT